MSCHKFSIQTIRPRAHSHRGFPSGFKFAHVAFLVGGCFLAGYPEKIDRYFAETRDLPVARLAVKPNSLHLGGLYVDKVKSDSDVMWCQLDSPLVFEEVWNQMFDFLITKDPMPIYRDGSHLALSMNVTLTAGPLESIVSDFEVLTQITNERKFNFDSNAQQRFNQQTQANAASYLLANHFSNVTDSAVDGIQELFGADYMRSLTKVVKASGGVPGSVETFERRART